MSWAKATMYRVIRTGAQAAIAAIGAAAVLSEVKWDVVAGATGVAMLLSFLMALAGLPEANEPAPLERDAGQANAGGVLIVALVSFVVVILVLLAFDLININ